MIACIVSLWIPLFFAGYCAVTIFGGGALLYYGAKSILKIPRISYWRSIWATFLWALVCVVMYVIFSIVGINKTLFSIPQAGFLLSLLCLCLALLWAWLVIRWIFKISSRKNIKAWAMLLEIQFLFAILISAFSLLPPSGCVRETTISTMSRANLCSIGKSILMYRGENDDNAYPPSLNELAEVCQLPEGILRYPRVSNDEPTSYFYLPPKQKGEKIDGETIIACEKKNVNTAGDGRNVLWVNGSVKYLTPEEFAAELAKPQNAAFAAALKQADGP